jgi:hypothetical protein
MNCNRVLRGIVAVMLVVLCESCSSEDVKEIQRVLSPDGQVEAVLATSEPHTTIARTTHLYVVPRGRARTDADLIMVGDYFSGVSIIWKDSRLLQIHYVAGRVFKFKNFWLSKDVENFRHVVEIRLVPRNEDYSLGYP